MTGLRRLTAAAIAAVFVAGAHAAGDELQPAVSPPATANVVPSPAVAATTGARPLRVLAADASAIVLADVRRTELYDEGRLHLYRMHVERVLRGRLDDADPGIAEVRGDSKRPPLAIDGEHVVVFLRPAWGQTYLTEHLPAGTYYTVVGARDGVVPVASEAQREAVERAIADGAAIATLDAPAAPAARRRLAFTELASTSPRLAGDALAELRGFATLSPLAPEELAALSRALRDVTVDPVVRVGLIELVADRHAGDAFPALAAAEADTPLVLTALLAARARLGHPADRAELAAYLGHRDPGVRAAAVRALARDDDPAALGEVGHYAVSDPDLGVRAAAIEALGASGRGDAVPVLTQTFETSERALQQRSAQALLAIGGPRVESALVDLALRGKSPQSQAYATLLLIASLGRNHPAVRRIEAANPSPEVRELLAHGLQFRETHSH